MTFITTDDGSIITTDTGQEIILSEPISNDDVQLFDFSVDLLRAILWEYNDADNLQALLGDKQLWYNENQSQFWADWYRNVFDLRTANEFGLEVWAIILGIQLFISNTSGTFAQWGFGSNNFNFSNGNFVPLNGGIFSLPLETKRLALKLRYFQLVSSGTVPEINRMLQYLFGEMGGAFLVDNHDMVQTYFFLFPVTWDLALLFSSLDILPRPAGVRNRIHDATQNFFGFGPNRVNFGNGNFEAQ